MSRVRVSSPALCGSLTFDDLQESVSVAQVKRPYVFSAVSVPRRAQPLRGTDQMSKLQGPKGHESIAQALAHRR
jgi:hypothetical protein